MIMKSGADNFFDHRKWSIFPPPNTWPMMTFLNPLDAMIPKKTNFHFLPNFGSGPPPGPGVSLGRILGGPSIEPVGGGLATGLFRPPPPVESPPTPALCLQPSTTLQILSNPQRALCC